MKVIAIEVLEQIKDKRTLEPLLNQLLAPTNSAFVKTFIARTLGELGDTQAVQGLQQVTKEVLGEHEDSQAIERLVAEAEEDYDFSKLSLIISIAVALAKLGNHMMAPVVIFLTNYSSDEEQEPETSTIRSTSVEALQYVVGQEMFPALKTALHDRNPDVRQMALEAMFYLGVKEVIPELILCLEDEHPSIPGNAYATIYSLIGEWPNGKTWARDIQVKELQEWWKQRQFYFKSGICYRLKKPIWLLNIITLLEGQTVRTDIVKDLRIITGKDFGFNPYIPAEEQDAVINQARKWWEVEGTRFEAGCLYKYGYKQNIHRIF